MDKKAESDWGRVIIGMIILVAVFLLIIWIFASPLSAIWKDFKTNAETKVLTKESCMSIEGKYPVVNPETGALESCNDCPKVCDTFDNIACTKGFCKELTCKLVNDKCVAG